MLGSIFVHEANQDHLAAIEGMEALNAFTTVKLDTLTTIDFVTMAAAEGLDWSDNRPVLFDEEGGLAIFRINPEALRFVIAAEDKLGEIEVSDIRKLRVFITKHGAADIHELATF